MTTKALFAMALSSLVVACAGTPPQPVQSAEPAATPTAPAPEQPKLADDTSRSNIAISEDIRKACGLSDAEAFFAYNSANVREQDKAILTKLATCFSSGPLKGRRMQLVGHADPRGDEEYNYLLGQRRADNVKSAIVSAGLPDSSVSTTSRGENDATGTDDAGWAKDRRVDVLLGS